SVGSTRAAISGGRGRRPLPIFAHNLVPDPVNGVAEFRARALTLVGQILLGSSTHDQDGLLGHAPDDAVRVEQFGRLADRPDAALDLGGLRRADKPAARVEDQDCPDPTLIATLRNDDGLACDPLATARHTSDRNRLL